MSVRMRQEIENKIVRAAVQRILEAGYSIAVDNGEDEESVKFISVNAVMRHMFETDEDRLYVYKKGAALVGWVLFIYGNDGYDVISDYSTTLERLLTDANEIGEYYDAEGPYITFEDWKQNKYEKKQSQ